MGSIDEKRKKIADDFKAILHGDDLLLIHQIIQELHKRKELCKAATLGSWDDGSFIELFEQHNERIKQLLRL